MILRSIACFTAAVSIPSIANAECHVSSAPDAVARKIDPTVQADANLIASMSMLPKLMHIDYAAAVKKKPACDLGSFSTAGSAYTLYSDERGASRTALPSKKGDPVAVVMPVTDLLKAIDASKQGKSAPIEGYLLATVTTRDFTGWRFYTGVPDAETLKHDMAQVLSGDGKPIFRNGPGNKTSLFVGK